MKTKRLRRILSLGMSAALAGSAFAIPAATVNAYGTGSGDPYYTVKIRDVDVCYTDVADFYVSNFPFAHDYDLDKTLSEECVVRAAETMVSYDTTDLWGDNYVFKSDENAYSDCHYNEFIIRGDGDVTALLDELVSDNNADFASPDYNQIGIGIVRAAYHPGMTYVCVRVTDEKSKLGQNITRYSDAELSEDKTLTLTTKATSEFVDFDTTPVDILASEYEVEDSAEVSYLMCGKNSPSENFAYIIPNFYANPADVLTPNTAEGKFTAAAAGTTTIYTYLYNSNNGGAVKFNKSITVKGNDLFDSCTFSFEGGKTAFDWVDGGVEPKVVGTTESGSPLTEGTDFRVSYSNNVNPGTATANIYGMGTYLGASASLEFTIEEKPADPLSVTLSAPSYSIPLGKSLKFTASAAGGTGTRTISFECTDSQGTTVDPIRTSTFEATYEPASSGTYTVTATVTDEANGTATDTKTFTVTDGLSIDVSTDKSTYALDEEGTLTVDIHGGTAPYTYDIYSDFGLYAGGETSDSSLECNFSSSDKGSYAIEVRVYDAAGDEVVDDSCEVTFTDGVSVSLECTTPSPVVGSRAYFSATSSGGSGSGTYKFTVTDPDGASTTETTGQTGSYNFIPQEDGTYNVSVTYMDASGLSATDSVDVAVTGVFTVSLKANADSYEVGGDPIILTADAQFGSQPYSYRIMAKHQDDVDAGKGYDLISEAKTASFTPVKGGTHWFIVKCKDNTGKEEKCEININVADNLPALVNNSSAPTKLIKGEPLVINGEASGREDIKYAYYYQKPGSQTFKPLTDGFVTATSASIRTTVAGKYKTKVIAKDEIGTTAEKVMTTTVKSEPNTPLSVNFKVSGLHSGTNSIISGEKVAFECSTSGGASAKYTFRHFYRRTNTNTWRAVEDDFAEGDTANVTLATLGTYDFLVIAKDNAGNTARETLTSAINVTEDTCSPVTVKTIQVNSHIFTGEDFTITAQADENSGTGRGYEFAYFIKSTNRNTWRALSDGFVESTEFTAKAPLNGNYTFKVVVRDSAGHRAELESGTVTAGYPK